MSKKPPSRADRIYRRLLRVFPFDFQREYGSEMEGVFRQERKRAAKRGPWVAARLWWRTLAGIIAAAPREHLDVLRQDIRFALRSLGAHKGFALFAVISLAIGIGANLAVFGLANALLLKPLAVADPDRVIRAYANRSSTVDYQDYVAYRDRNQTISNLSAFQGVGSSVRIGDSPESILVCAVTGSYFGEMGVSAAIGRTIAPVDDQAGAPGAAMLSDAFWRRRFSADPAIIGRALTINGSLFTIVGVSPAWFSSTMAPIRPEVWLPWSVLERGRPSSAHLIGRLRPWVSVEQAQADMSRIAGQLTQERGRAVSMTVYPARTLHPAFSTAVSAFVAFLMAIVALILTIACLNIATVLLARAVERSREMGIRIALGAGRTQLMRQLLTEGLLLAAAGGGAATLLALIAAQTVPLSISGLPGDVIALDIAFDWRVGLFAILISITTTLLSALAPALQCVRTAVMPALKDGALTTAPTRSRLRAIFIVAQLAMSTLLLVIGALLVRTLTNPQTASRGFDTDGVLTAALNLESTGYTPRRGMEFYERLLERLETTPGIVSANIARIVPLTLSNWENTFQWETNPVPVRMNVVSRGHFRTLGIPLLQGRDFNANDRYENTAVGIVNETLARRLWPGESPVGKRLDDVEIVGLVRDSKYAAMGEDPKNFLYRPISQWWVPEGSLLVKTQGDPLNVLPGLRAVVQSLDPDLPLLNINPLDRATGISFLPLQMAAALAGVLGLGALILGAVGVYGVVSFFVRQRTREVGIRIALGAPPSAVVSLLTRQVMCWAGIGLCIGMLAGLGVGQLLENVIYGITPTDPIAFIGIPLLLACTAYGACWFPAKRATRIDPFTALREE